MPPPKQKKNEHLKLDLNDIQGSSSQTIPPDLATSLDLITQLKPDRGMISYIPCYQSSFARWYKHEAMEEKLHRQKDWRDPDIPVQRQGPHRTCWSAAGSENISDARHIHGVDKTYTPYSGPYMMDCVNLRSAKVRLEETQGTHYCYGYSAFRGLEYVMNNGIPKRDAWITKGCGGGNIPDGNLGGVRRHHVLNDVKKFVGVNKALDYLEIQPILGCLAVFRPEFDEIKDGDYRGPETEQSEFVGWHTVSIRYIEVINGETIAHVKNSHGLNSGVQGHIKVSMDVILLELKKGDIPSFPSAGRLFRSFTYGEVRPEYEKEVVEWYLDGEKNYNQTTGSKDTTSLILQGIFCNTSGGVFEYEDGEEIIGTPIDRALFKWAMQLEVKMNVTYSKVDSSITGSYDSYRQCQAIIVNDQNGKIRIHWKGKAEFLLSKCTKYDSNGAFLEMSNTKKTELKAAIEDMAERDLICIALAIRETTNRDLASEMTVQPKKKRKVMPCDNLILLAIFGIKNPCVKGDDERQACLDFEKVEEDYLADLDESAICPSERAATLGTEEFPVLGLVKNSRVRVRDSIVSSRQQGIRESKETTIEGRFQFDRIQVTPEDVRKLNLPPEHVTRTPSGETFVKQSLQKGIQEFVNKANNPFQGTQAAIEFEDDEDDANKSQWAYLADSGICPPIPDGLKKFAVRTIGAVDNSEEKLNYEQGFVRDFVPSALASLECQEIRSLCQGFNILPTLLYDGCCLNDRGTGVYGFPIEIQALFSMALRSAVLLLEEDGEGTEMEEIIKQRNEVFGYTTEEYSHSAVNKFSVTPGSLPEWTFNYMSPHRGLFVGAMLAPQEWISLDLTESRGKALVGERPLKVCYPTNSLWSYHNGGSSWPVLTWRLLTATCIKAGRTQIEAAEARLHKDHSPENNNGELGGHEQARKCQNWSITGHSVQRSAQEATGYVEEEGLVANSKCGLSSSAISGEVDANMF